MPTFFFILNIYIHFSNVVSSKIETLTVIFRVYQGYRLKKVIIMNRKIMRSCIHNQCVTNK